jgi:hypothetical protein
MEQLWFLIGALKVDADKCVLPVLFPDTDPLVSLKIQQAIRQLPGPWTCQPLCWGFSFWETLAHVCFCPAESLLP